jgi:hypothetical protein
MHLRGKPLKLLLLFNVGLTDDEAAVQKSEDKN